MDLSHKIIIVLLIILILLTVYKKQENAGSTSGSTSTEAVANIAKVYADSAGIATFNNIQITGNLKIGAYNLSVDASNNLNIKDFSNNIIFTGKSNAVNIPNMSGGTYTGGTYVNSTINTPQIKNGVLMGCGLMDPDGRYGLYVNKVWNNKYGILMYDTNSNGNGAWASMPTRIQNGQLGYGNGYIRGIMYKSQQTPNGNGNGGARFFYVGTNDTTDPEKPITTAFFRDYPGREQNVAGD